MANLIEEGTGFGGRTSADRRRAQIHLRAALVLLVVLTIVLVCLQAYHII